mmetsp:Transcript_56841/g.158306  ORF Transcript_56841/g.158306 Transcript_56841/m.158306 type:complete len:260 (-) Transcript_56841:208-987(-)
MQFLSFDGKCPIFHSARSHSTPSTFARSMCTPSRADSSMANPPAASEPITLVVDKAETVRGTMAAVGCGSSASSLWAAPVRLLGATPNRTCLPASGSSNVKPINPGGRPNGDGRTSWTSPVPIDERNSLTFGAFFLLFGAAALGVSMCSASSKGKDFALGTGGTSSSTTSPSGKTFLRTALCARRNLFISSNVFFFQSSSSVTFCCKAATWLHKYCTHCARLAACFAAMSACQAALVACEVTAVTCWAWMLLTSCNKPS